MRRLNLIGTAAEINRLRKLVDNQKDTILKGMECIEVLADDCCKLQEENKKLKGELRKLKHELQIMKIIHSTDDVIFPNTDERGLGDGDTPNDLSPLDL